jgi:betaine-aldehyde dehydrogenase
MNHAVAKPAVQRIPFLVGGEWRTGSAPALPAINPASGELLGEVGAAGPDDVDAAVRAAQAAQPAWAALRGHQRAALLQAIAARIEQHAEALALTQTRENGKPLAESRQQAKSAAGIFRYYAAEIETFAAEVTPPRGDYVSMTSYEPLGVVAAITPWNSPLTMDAQKAAPALAAGNAVILKPSELTPQTSLALGRLCLEAGLPPGLLNVLPGSGADTGAALVQHPGVRMISFTGGTATGRAIARVAAERMIPACFELGGKSPQIVFADADVERALEGVLWGIFEAMGQSCVAGSRLFVQQALYPRFVEALVAKTRALRLGPPEDPHTQVGPLASEQRVQHVDAIVQAACRDGAQLLCGGARPAGAQFGRGAYYLPTILAGMRNDAAVCQTEIFGPVLCVLPFADEEDLVAQANHSEFGLACGIWSADFARAWRVARRIEAGTVWINTYKQLSITTPFGGYKQSGLGREKGRQGLLPSLQAKSIYLAT